MRIVPIRGYEGLYEISDTGMIWRVPGFWCRKRRLLVLTESNRRLRARLCRMGERQGNQPRFLVHRLVYEHFVGPIPNGLTINHIDGNPLNNRVNNLEVANMSQQMIHAYATGLQVRAKGEARGKVCKLNSRQVLEIRRKYKSGKYHHADLAREFEVTPSNICMIVNKRRWSHI